METYHVLSVVDLENEINIENMFNFGQGLVFQDLWFMPSVEIL